ncbi:tetratricopeptide repeat protein [Streptomyces sp. CA-135486]|uniref:tetratricopeptide repeat protein n=1 Tax=Streptomyces sp. CA-135486 TaxID=3240049 RepID=UPI003D8B94A8
MGRLGGGGDGRSGGGGTGNGDQPSRNNLATTLFRMGAPTEAIRLLQRVLDDRARVLGLEHPHTRASRGELETALAASRVSPRRHNRWWRLRRRTAPAGTGR